MNTIAEMRDAVFFDGENSGRRYSRFWLLLVLSAVIAAAGVVGDSTATVIGAMIVAPLMTPILGIVLATTLGDRANLARCWALVIGGALAAVAIGYSIGLLVPSPVIAETNPQVAGRVTPDLIDLLAALATGVVGAVALIRKDISDTIVGVAIAISLVPPLSVVGLTLQAREWGEALGALLLFVTNVAAILGTGVVVMILYRLSRSAQTPRSDGRGRRLHPLVSILVSLALIGVPLALSSVRFTQQSLLEYRVREAAEPWAESVGWDVVGLEIDGTAAALRITGAPPLPDTAALEAALQDLSVDPSSVTVELIPAYRVTLGTTP